LKASLLDFALSFEDTEVFDVGRFVGGTRFSFWEGAAFDVVVGLACAGLYVCMSVKYEKPSRSCYLSVALGIALTDPGAGDDSNEDLGAACCDAVVDMGPAAPTILTAFFLSFKLPAFAAG
jgi:hypothetical protein